MTQREQTLNKYLEDINLHESVRDAIHDAMKEHAIGFHEWADIDYMREKTGTWVSFNDYTQLIMHEDAPVKRYTSEQLYNKFNLNK